MLLAISGCKIRYAPHKINHKAVPKTSAITKGISKKYNTLPIIIPMHSSTTQCIEIGNIMINPAVTANSTALHCATLINCSISDNQRNCSLYIAKYASCDNVANNKVPPNTNTASKRRATSEAIPLLTLSVSRGNIKTKRKAAMPPPATNCQGMRKRPSS